MSAALRVLLVDLNNFARYPTISIGYLCALLRRAGVKVEVFSPLAHGVSGLTREPRERSWSLIDQWLRYRTATSTWRCISWVRERMQRLRSPIRPKTTRRLLFGLQEYLERRPDVVLVSAYLMYFEWCSVIGKACNRIGAPMVIGGGYFTEPAVIKAWLGLPGVVAVVGGEPENHVVELVRAVAEGRDITTYPGVSVPGKPAKPASPPLQDLDSVPFPDYSDYPWDLYPSRIIPMITGRGCHWGVCSFCSDVTSSMGRTFRSRSPSNVLEEAAFQSRSCLTSLFVFTDLKLNSNLLVWRSLLEGFQQAVPGGRWIGAVHVGANGDNGLTSVELRRARRAGAVRLTTGLESGSQRILELMRKGTDLQVTSRFLHDAAESGISVRTTLIVGYPGERSCDLVETARFLDLHAHCIDRVIVNRFSLIMGTPFSRQLAKDPRSYPELYDLTQMPVLGSIKHRLRTAREPDYKRSMFRVLEAAHRINRKRLNVESRVFEGVM